MRNRTAQAKKEKELDIEITNESEIMRLVNKAMKINESSEEKRKISKNITEAFIG